ncbi:MAG TPA: M20/M25/M40 family metallo-hydrolase [Gammaproteobacteria bacterium]|jgi:glutamate carboxypeptidase|nr:M20/M25/M40 family metallo-hydrolase [Gammaproteobacteria bacterium]
MKRQQCIFIAIFLFFTLPLQAQTLSPIEQNIRLTIEQQQPAQLALLKKLVNINSGTNNIAGVKRVGDIMRTELKQLGFKTQWVYPPAGMKRAPTLIAKREGTQGKRLLLIGHLDTVYAPQSPFKQFELKDNGIAKGPGVIDDKGGLVIILFALKALHAVHALDNTTITVVLTGDEEDSGKPTTISRKPLREAANNMDIALDFEPAMTLQTVSIARRGITNWTITSQGNEAHSATIFHNTVGDGAIFELSRILTAMHKQLKGEKYLVFNPGLIVGGTQARSDRQAGQGSAFGKQNVVAKTAIAEGDLRFIDPQQEQAAQTKMINIVAQSLPGTHSTIQFEPGIPAMPPTDTNLKLAAAYSAVSVDLGYGAIKTDEPGSRGAGDISHVAGIVPANLVGLGATGSGMHSIAERIELRSLPVQTKKTAIFIYRCIL